MCRPLGPCCTAPSTRRGHFSGEPFHSCDIKLNEPEISIQPAATLHIAVNLLATLNILWAGALPSIRSRNVQNALQQGFRRTTVAQEQQDRARLPIASVEHDSGAALPWAYGVVGYVQTVGDWWLRHQQPISREALGDYLTTFLWGGVSGIAHAADIPGGLAAYQEETRHGL